ncbi:tyrosine-type recombinase/integrase [Candidatus Neomarinimicrobiota bacterium]
MKVHLAKNHISRTDFIKRYSTVFKQCCILVGIKNKHLHHIRHTFAVRRYIELRDIYQVAKELGHSSVTTTEIYAKFNLSRLEHDFPSLLSSAKKAILGKEFSIRDTDIRDTHYINSSIARG